MRGADSAGFVGIVRGARWSELVEGGVHLGLERGAAGLLRGGGFMVGFEVGVSVFDRDVVVDVVARAI